MVSLKKSDSQNHLSPAGHTSLHVAQDIFSFQGSKYALLSYIFLLTEIFSSELFSVSLVQPVFVIEIAPTHLKDLTLNLAEHHDVCMGPLLKLVKVLLDGISSLQYVGCRTQLGDIQHLFLSSSERKINLIKSTSVTLSFFLSSNSVLNVSILIE